MLWSLVQVCNTMVLGYDTSANPQGTGFGGVYQLKKLRDAGYNVKLVEAGVSGISESPHVLLIHSVGLNMPGSARCRALWTFNCYTHGSNY